MLCLLYKLNFWVGAEGKAAGTYTCLCAGTWVSAAPAWERQQWSPGAGVAAPSVLCLAVVNTLSTSKPVLSRCFGLLRCTAWHRGLRAPDVCTSLSEALVPSSSLFIFAQLNIKASKHLVCLCSAVCPITFFQGSHIVPVASLGAGSVEPGCQW